MILLRAYPSHFSLEIRIRAYLAHLFNDG